MRSASGSRTSVLSHISLTDQTRKTWSYNPNVLKWETHTGAGDSREVDVVKHVPVE